MPLRVRHASSRGSGAKSDPGHWLSHFVYLVAQCFVHSDTFWWNSVCDNILFHAHSRPCVPPMPLDQSSLSPVFKSFSPQAPDQPARPLASAHRAVCGHFSHSERMARDTAQGSTHCPLAVTAAPGCKWNVATVHFQLAHAYQADPSTNKPEFSLLLCGSHRISLKAISVSWARSMG